MKVLYSIYITLIILFVSVFIFEHRDILTLGEQLCILSLGLNSSLFASRLLTQEEEKE